MKTTPYTAFGKTRLVPIRVFLDGKQVEQDWFQDSLWVERGEDWYALMSHRHKNTPTLVVERNDWLKAAPYEN